MSGLEPGVHVVAGENVGPLGIVFAGMPPGYPAVKAVKEGTWAEEVGIQAGWIVFELNGDDLIDMPREVFVQHLKARPIKLYLEPPTPPETDSEGSSSGIQRSSLRRGSRGSLPRGSRASVLKAAAERRRSSGNAEAVAQLKLEEMQLDEARNEAKQLRMQIKQERYLAENANDPSALYDELVAKLRYEKTEWDRVSEKQEAVRRTEQDQVLDLQVELETDSKKAVVQQKLAAEATRYQDPQIAAESKEFASLLFQVRREEDTAALDRDRWQRMKRGSQFAAGMDIELKLEARVRDIEQAIDNKRNMIRDPTTFHIHAEQEEIRLLQERIDVQAHRVKMMNRAHRSDVVTATAEAIEEQHLIKKLEKMELKRLRKSEWENAQFTIRADDPLSEEVAYLRENLPHEGRMEVRMTQEIDKLENLQTIVGLGGTGEEVHSLRAAGAQAAMEVGILNGRAQEHAAWVGRSKEELASLQLFLQDGKQGPLKLALRRVTERVRQLTLDHAKSSGLLKTREVSGRQERQELGNLTSAYTEESSEFGRVLEQYLLSESARGKWNSEFNSLRPKLTYNEALVGRLRAEVYHHEQVQNEAQAMTLDGPLGRAEVIAFEQTFQEEQTLAEAQARARNAARIADHAEMSALHSALKHEEAEVYKITNTYASGRDATEITTLRNALARERSAMSVAGTAYKERWAEAQEGIAQTREVAELRSKLMQGESAIGRLQQRLELAFNPAPLPVQSPGQFSRERAEVARLREILSREQAMISQIRVKIAQLEVATADAQQVTFLKDALAGAHTEHGALQKKLLDRTQKSSPELAAARSALIVEQTELRMLRERAPPEPLVSPHNPFAAEAAELEGKLTSEKLELQMLHQRMATRAQPPKPADVPSHYHYGAGDASLSRLLQAEIASERTAALELEKQLAAVPPLGQAGGAPPGSMAAAEIAVLKTELANAELAAAPSSSHSGFEYAGGRSHDYTINLQRGYDTVLSGSQLSQMAKQVEAAELGRLEGIIDRCKEAMERERAGHLELKHELHSLQLCLESEEQSLEQLRNRLNDVHSQTKRVHAANEMDLSGLKVAIIRKEAELEQLQVRLASVIQKEQPGHQFEVVVPKGTKSMGITTSLPPNIRVESCAPNSWAAAQGIEIGDQLHTVNKQIAADLSKAELAKLMRERPLRMQFTRSAMQGTVALKKMQEKNEDENIRLRGQMHSLESQMRQLMADRDLLKIKFGVAESEVKAQNAAARTGYEGELRHMQDAFKIEEVAMTSRTQDELQIVAEKTKQATLAEEELAIQELQSDNSALDERNTEEFLELGEMRAAFMHEKQQVGQLHAQLSRYRQERDQAELKAASSQSARFEHVTNMRRSLLAVQVAQQEMEDVANDKQRAISLEEEEAENLRPKYAHALEMVQELQELVMNAQMSAESKEAIRTVRAAEIDALKTKLSSEKVESSFGRHEVMEVDALRAAHSQEVAVEHRLQRALSGAEARLEACQIEQHAELSSLQAAVKHAEQIDNRLSDNMSQQVVQMANLEAELQQQNERVAKAQTRSALTDLKNKEKEALLLDFEQREESVISCKMLGGAARADARVLSAEAGSRTVEEQAAEWCAEAAMDAREIALAFAHRGFKGGDRKQQVKLLRQELNLQRALDGAESELQRQERRARAEGLLLEETAQMRLQLTEETRAAHMANANTVKARNAEARVLQNALAEVRDASLKSTAVIRQRDEFLTEESEYRWEAESQDDMLQDLREMMVQRAARPQPTTSGNTASLDSMLHAAHGMLDGGNPAPAAMDALVALSSATPGGGMSPAGLTASPRNPGRGRGLGIAGGISVQPSREGLNSHALQLRVQAEGLRQDMERFQAARQGRRSYR